MLYQVHEMQRAVLEPWRWWARASAEVMASPLSPLSFAPTAKNAVAGLDLMLRLTDRYARPTFGIEQVMVNGVSVTVTEAVLLDKSFCQCLRWLLQNDCARIAPSCPAGSLLH